MLSWLKNHKVKRNKVQKNLLIRMSTHRKAGYQNVYYFLPLITISVVLCNTVFSEILYKKRLQYFANLLLPTLLVCLQLMLAVKR